MINLSIQIAPHHIAAIACFALAIVLTIVLAIGDKNEG